MTMSRYAYDYSLTPVRPTGWRATFATVTVVGTVMAVSAISGALVTLQLFASTPPTVTPPVATASAVAPASQPVATRVIAMVTKAVSDPVARHEAEPPATTVAAPAAPQVAPPVAAPPGPTPAAAVAPPAPIAESELTFAKGYAQRHAIANGAVVRHGKVLVAAHAQLGRAAKPKPKVYARNNATSLERRRADTAHSDAYGMFQRFDRPDQFDFNRHQALAYGEQRATRRRNDTPPPPRPNGFFGGLF